MIAILGAMLLVCIGGYLIGTQRERDRSKRKAAASGTSALPPAADWTISDREWERFVCAIYDLADGEPPREG